MSLKSMMLSILALILYVGILVGTIFLFKVHYMLVLVGVALLFVPFKIQRMAIANSNGKIDSLFCKVIVPALCLIAIVFVVLFFTIWS